MSGLGVQGGAGKPFGTNQNVSEQPRLLKKLSLYYKIVLPNTFWRECSLDYVGVNGGRKNQQRGFCPALHLLIVLYYGLGKVVLVVEY